MLNHKVHQILTDRFGERAASYVTPPIVFAVADMLEEVIEELGEVHFRGKNQWSSYCRACRDPWPCRTMEALVELKTYL